MRATYIGFSILLPSLGSSAPLATAAYSIIDICSGSSFLSCFDFFTDTDPTHGFVRYLGQSDAQSQGLFSVSGNTVTLAADSKNKAPSGRASLRMQSKKFYSRGLFVLDLAHMPSSTCGSWPSFWSWGAKTIWPKAGEIDIIEGVNMNAKNAMSLHTSNGCSIDGTGSLGTVNTKNCYVNAAGQSGNAGCGIESSSLSSYGTPFNSGGGGVYAMEWTSSGVKIWFFPRNSIPSDLAANNPSPSTWGIPQANFQGACDFNQHFVDHQLVIDTTFCGDWAGAIWGDSPSCSKLGSCTDYVANNPGAFSETYWKINYLKVFQQ